MSMLSAQCDKLRAMAESVGLSMPQVATLMMDAADTIWELRGSVLRERAEADKLRDMVHALLQCKVEGYDIDICAKCNYRSPLHGGCMADVKADELGVEL